MPRLFLHELNKSLYQPNMACAYIYYGQYKKAKDQHDKPITPFYQEPFALQKYLSSTVLPIVADGLKDSAYKATEVSFENQAPHPYIAIMRRDQQNISNNDLSSIKKLLNNITKNTFYLNFFANKKEIPEVKATSAPKTYTPSRG